MYIYTNIYIYNMPVWKRLSTMNSLSTSPLVLPSWIVTIHFMCVFICIFMYIHIYTYMYIYI